MRIQHVFAILAPVALAAILLLVIPATAAKTTGRSDGRGCGLDFSKAVPSQLNYQGLLADASDSSAINATLEMTFRLFDSETKGAELWSETHASVEIQGGLFQVLLGSVTPFPDGLFDGSKLWLQTEVVTEVLTPRKPLVSMAYSQQSEMADQALQADDASHLESQSLLDLDDRWVNEDDMSSLDAADGDPAEAVYVDDDGKVGIGITSPLTELDVNGSVNATTYYGDGSNLTGISGTADADWTISGSHIYSAVPGSVGIGTSSPEKKLHVVGDVKATTYYGDGSNLTGISGTTDNDWTIDGDNVYHQTGKVGIGTISPTTLLHISQDATEAPGTHPHTKMIIEDGNSSTYVQIMAPASNTRALLFGESGAGGQVNDGQIGYENVNGMRFWVDRSGSDLIPVQIKMDGDVVMNEGDVGIGTADPLASLHVQTTNLFLPGEALSGEELCVEAQDAVLGLYSSSSGSVGSILTLGEVTGGALVDKWAMLRETPTGGSGLRFTYGTHNNPWSNDAVLYLDDTGNVGIGTTSPNAALDVSGHINIDKGGIGGVAMKVDGAEAIRASTPGADSYFTWGYGATANYFPDPVGIGTSDPQEDLEIRKATPSLRIAANNNSESSLQLYEMDGSEPYGFELQYEGDDENLSLWSRGFDGFDHRRMVWQSNGNVAIGTEFAGSQLSVAGENEAAVEARCYSSTHPALSANNEVSGPSLRTYHGDIEFYYGNLKVGYGAPDTYRLYVIGDAYSTGDWYGSDGRFKRDIRGVEDPLEKVRRLRGVSYRWKTEKYPDKGFSEGRHYGVIAQEVEQILPEIVKEDSQGSKAVAYAEIIPVLIEAVKELSEENEELRARVYALETQ